MAGSNLRPMSTACNLLIGAAQSKDGADREVKQREWIWEFFLKNSSNGPLLVELMTAFPFPDENLHLKRLLLLRSLSLQLSSGLFDELTLDILKALEETSCQSEDSRAGVDRSEVPVHPVKKRRVVEKDKDIDTETANPEGMKVAVKRGLPESLVGRKSSRSRKEGVIEEQITDKTEKGKNLPDGDSTVPKDTSFREKLFCLEGQGPLWELQLAVMVELTVKHLRGVSFGRKAFEAALNRYWGDFIMDTEESVAEWQDFDRERQELKKELWKVHTNLDFLDEVTCKYTEERVRNMLSTFLENAWAEKQVSFLERVSSDVVNGIYEPQNPDVQRRKVGRAVGEDGVAVNRRELVSEKPFVRSSRGKFSRSREKLQKAFGVFEIHARRELENEEGVSPVNLMDGAGNERSTEVVKTRKTKGTLGTPPQTRTAEESLQTAGNTSRGFCKDTTVSGLKILDTSESEDEEFDHEEAGRSQHCDEVRSRHEEAKEAQDERLPEKHTVCDQFAEDSRNADTSPCSPKTLGTVDSSPEGLHKGKSLSHGDREVLEEPCHKAKYAGLMDGDLEPPTNERTAGNIVVDLSSPSPQPLAQIQGSLSPPPWVTSSLRTRKNLASELKESRPASHVEVEARNPRSEVPGGAEDPEGNSGPDSAERSRKGKYLQSEVNVVSSPKAQEAAAVQQKFMQRNSSARTFEWEEEDDISESPPGPTRSKPATTGQISPSIASRRASSQVSTQRRKPRKWSAEETELLKNQVFKYGKGRWKLILANNRAIFDGRTEVDLKDKWRNLERFEGLSVRDG